MTARQEAALRRAVLMRDADAAVRAAEPLARHAVHGYYADGHDRDDLLQVARIAIADALNRFHGPPEAFPSFAIFCARRQVQDALRTARRVKRRAQAEAVSLHAPAGDRHAAWVVGDFLEAGRGPHETVVALDEARRALRRIATDLSPLERDALIGCVLQGLPYHQVGPRKRVGNAIQRARRKLAA